MVILCVAEESPVSSSSAEQKRTSSTPREKLIFESFIAFLVHVLKKGKHNDGF